MELRTLLTYLVILLIQLFALSSIFIALVGTNDDVNVDQVKNDNVNNGEGEKVEKNEFSTDRVTAGQNSEIVDKIVIMIIDAMRFDFIPQMEFIQKGLEKENFGCLFQVSLDGPTVTLPRIKALVSGASSNYWEILTNLKQSSQMGVDNFIWRANRKGKQIVFYGDDTWLKLFPNQEFKRKEGVTSFFVTDFYEVDNNVTRNVDAELQEMDFDMMILHYLGIDHVGHVHGPKHSLIPIKLKEMDQIIQNMYDKLKSLAQMENRPHILIITGDHGMANQGGHGGDSQPEVTTPLVVLTVTKDNNSSICKSGRNWMDSPFKLKQGDIATTISSLWNLPLPSKSRGIIAPELFSQLSPLQILSILHENARHLSKFLKEKDSTTLNKFNQLTKKLEKISSSEKKEQELLISEYFTLLQEIQSLSVQDSNQDTFLLYLSTVLLFQSGIMLLICDLLNISTTIGLFYTVCVPFILILMSNNVLPIDNSLHFSILILVIINLFFIFTVSFLKHQKKKINFSWSFYNMSQKQNQKVIFLIHVLNYIIPILYFSSSFVEEEHLPTYYLYTTALVISWFASSSSSSIGKYNAIKSVIKLTSLIMIHRLCSSLNATGQKWNYLPDTNDFLNENKLSELVTLGTFILIYFRLKTIVEKVTVFTISVYKLNVIPILVSSIFRDFNITSYNNNYAYLEAQLCYVLIILTVLYTRSRGCSFWILLCCLLQRKENIILILLVDIQVELIQNLNNSEKENLQIKINSKKKNVNQKQQQLFYFSSESSLLSLLMFSSFFYQGNSNNITTIDISLGYTGLSTYNEYIVGSLTFIATFSLPLLVIIRSLFPVQSSHISSASIINVKKGNHDADVFCDTLKISLISTIMYKIIFTNFIYSIVLILMRQHLFIWSVFVPKLLYLIAFTFLLFCIVFILCIYMTIVIVSRSKMFKREATVDTVKSK